MTGPAIQTGEAVDNFSIWSGIGVGADQYPYFVALNLNPMHFDGSWIQIGAVNGSLHVFAWSDYLQLISIFLVYCIAG